MLNGTASRANCRHSVRVPRSGRRTVRSAIATCSAVLSAAIAVIATA